MTRPASPARGIAWGFALSLPVWVAVLLFAGGFRG